LAARIMEKAGVVQMESPKEVRLNRIKDFANRFLNADSDVDDIAKYKDELDAIINGVQVRVMRGGLSRANMLY